MGPQPGHKCPGLRHHCANFPSRTGWAHPQPPPSQAGGFLLALPGCVKQKAWNGARAKGGRKRGCVVSLPPPHCFKVSPFPLQRKGIYLQKKSPLDGKRSRPPAWESQAISPQSGSGPVHFNSCTFMEDHKKGTEPCQGAEAWGWEVYMVVGG
jgi:hypothetical protein